MTTRAEATFRPPVMEARRWLDAAAPPAGLPLLNVSQAAPVDPPPAALRDEMARLVTEVPEVHLYGPVLGLPELRGEIAERWSAAYGGAVAASQVAVTAGCNQAFCAAIAALTGEGDQVILPTPWYFNHKMWLDMSGVEAVPLSCDDELLPDPERAAALVTPRTRAIVLVTPNNPGGVEYPADVVAAFYHLAQERGLTLILDETYRDFDARPGPPHGLFGDPDWPRHLVHLYSFSKAFRLTGHRTGAMIAAEGTLAQAEKFLDTVAICAPQLGQHAALWGLRNLSQWLAGERAEILDRRAAIEEGAGPLARAGWRLTGVGAYFAYFEHPFAMPSDTLARRMVGDIGVLALPGTMFMPEADETGARHLRVAYANVDRDGIAELYRRLATLAYPLAETPPRG
ncbi:aminotransferase [Rhodosalinus halophilus]|uniref:aspartate transaminase n=1 Tax=Rhodosalinus halophilus TaxID=2259333 RepID=A0A365U8M0_9RHOB|nr:aminotransferase [Rhodosalinus halophilus]RBI85002.1 aminotransferase [Rhodosalinus halophilus]